MKKLLSFMILGIVLHSVTLEIIEYREQKRLMQCMYNRYRTKQFNKVNECNKRNYQTWSYKLWPDRPYLSDCLVPNNNGWCKVFNMKLMEFEEP